MFEKPPTESVKPPLGEECLMLLLLILCEDLWAASPKKKHGWRVCSHGRRHAHLLPQMQCQPEHEKPVAENPLPNLELKPQTFVWDESVV